MDKYEYTQTYIELAIDGINHIEKLNSFGNDGWELISVINMDGRNICYYFKRKKERTLLMETKSEEQN